MLAKTKLVENWFKRIIWKNELQNSGDEVIKESIEKAKAFMPLEKKDVVVITGGYPNNDVNRTTNLMQIEEI